MKNHLKNLPSTKNPTRLIYTGLAIWWLAKIAYQFIEGWHWSATEYGFEWWLLYAGSSLVTIGLILHWFSFKEILEVYRKQMIMCVNRMLKSEIKHNRNEEDYQLLIEQKDIEIKRLIAEVEFHKGSAKGQQNRADQATSFGKTMEAANSILLQTQSRLNKTVDSQDKTIKLLVKSQLEVINNLTAPQIITQEYKPELILPGKSEGSVLYADH